MKAHEVGAVRFRGDQLVIVVDDQTHVFDLGEISPRLAAADPQERARFEISPSGYGIRWPLIDEDLSIDGLLGTRHRPRRPAKRGRKSAGSRRHPAEDGP